MKTKCFRHIAFLTAVVLVLSSCQKEAGFQDDIQVPPVTPPDGSGANINGDWIFIGETAKTRATAVISEAGLELKAITESSYKTENNAGTLQITDKQFIFKGITSSVNGIGHTKTYMNGVLLDESDMPFMSTSPAADYTYDYVRNSADSITFTDGSGMIPTAPGSPTPVQIGPIRRTCQY